MGQKLARSNIEGITNAKLHSRLSNKWIKRKADGDGDSDSDDLSWLPKQKVGKRRHTLVVDL